MPCEAEWVLALARCGSAAQEFARSASRIEDGMTANHGPLRCDQLDGSPTRWSRRSPRCSGYHSVPQRDASAGCTEMKLLDRILNDPDVPLDAEKVWSLLDGLANMAPDEIG